MRLYLVQHGPARSKEEDPDRPLSEEGDAVVQRVAARLGECGEAPVDRVLHSGKARARQTAEILAEHLHPEGGVRAVDDLGPVDDPGLWAERLPGFDDDSDEDGDPDEGGVMLVGHLPYMERMVSLLVRGDTEEPVVRFEQGGVLCLKREGRSWVIAWYLAPGLA